LVHIIYKKCCVKNLNDDYIIKKIYPCSSLEKKAKWKLIERSSDGNSTTVEEVELDYFLDGVEWM
jgi:hypothetical protein